MRKITCVIFLLLGACSQPGAPGVNGVDGKNGLNGTNGSNGADANPVTIVQLCPDITTYPGVFVEVALCIQGKLYGVYSNPVFMTELPPGNYASAAIGSACNLTIGENCVITH